MAFCHPAGEVKPVPVPSPLQIVLMDKFDAKVNATSVDKAIERATALRAVADSARSAGQPKSSVPLPGTPGPGQGKPSGAAPVPNKP